jgi:hypothetical protein
MAKTLLGGRIEVSVGDLTLEAVDAAVFLANQRFAP